MGYDAYAGRFPDFGGGKGDNVIARATNAVCEEFKIPSVKAALAKNRKHHGSHPSAR